MANDPHNKSAIPPAEGREADEKPEMELEHAVGYSSLPGGLFYHPNGRHLVYAAGGTVVICDFNDPHEQHILTGHDGMITCIALGNSGRWVAKDQHQVYLRPKKGFHVLRSLI